MDKKSSDVINNICTLLGGALILYPLIDEATKTLIPEMQKLTSDETMKQLDLLTLSESTREEHDKPEHKERKPQDDEIAELKRKLAEYESKSEEHTGE